MKTILVDINNVAHASHHGTKLTSGHMQTQAIYGSMRTLRAVKQEFPGARMLVLWDGKPQFRYDALPEYKANREIKDDPKRQAEREAFEKQVPYLRKAIEYLGVTQYFPTHCEADDLAGVLCRQLVSQGDEVVLLSGDTDWLQLVDKGVLWYDSIRERKVTLENFLEFSGFFTPQEYVQGKALRGDKNTDNVPGVGGIGEKGAYEFMAEYRDVYAFIKKVRSGELKPRKKALQKLASLEGEAMFERNMALIDLSRTPSNAFRDVKIVPGLLCTDKLQALCDALMFKSISDHLLTFTTPFNNMVRSASNER